MQEIIGATVVIENRSGAGGITGSESVASAPADGYTLLMTTGSHIGNKVFNAAQVRYDPLQSFTPVAGLIESNGIVLVARKDIPADSVATLNAYAKSKPNGLTYGHAGIGNISFVAGELLKLQAGMPLSGIPYRGTAAVLTDLIGGQVDLCFVGISGARSYIDNGQVKVIASTGAERAPVLPGVQTMREAGYPDFVVLGYIGLWAPHDTPKPVVTRLYDAVKEALARPNIQDLLATFGAATEATPPEEFARFLERISRPSSVGRASSASSRNKISSATRTDCVACSAGDPASPGWHRRRIVCAACRRWCGDGRWSGAVSRA